jgi:formylglycine-generating enzyme required for sulfatase activity
MIDLERSNGMLTDVQSQLGEQIQEARSVTDALFETIRPGSLYERPIAERHRLVFYLGHLEAFDWNLLGRRALGTASFHPDFDKLFEFGIDPPEGSEPADQPADWPRGAEISAYNQRVRAKLDQHLGDIPEQLLHVAIEHRLMHAETLAYLLHGLDYQNKQPQPSAAIGLAPPASPRMIDIPEGSATLGQSPEEFGWDNEYARHGEASAAFRIAKYKVTNGEYLHFVNSGAPAPHFWVQRDGRWFLRGMFEELPLPLDWPVYVTQHQASLYAASKGLRLPTETEFHRAAYDDRAILYPWGDAPPDASRGNFDFSRWDPAPVTAYPAGDSIFGVSQLVGNGWEWTSTAFAPFPGFEPFPFYPGYSANFFDGEHYVMKGASPRTAACFLRPSFRNWFRGRYPYAYATFRLAGD